MSDSFHNQTLTKPLKQVTRIGVYGVAIQSGNILLTFNRRGYYINRWSLPGGGIEFGETAEETLRREFKEEVGMKFSSMKLLDNLSYTGNDPFPFHHLGQIYLVSGCQNILDAVAEDEYAWHPISQLSLDIVAPFVQQILKKIS
jgi:8-oxo-dGTP diphosphatase